MSYISIMDNGKSSTFFTVRCEPNIVSIPVRNMLIFLSFKTKYTSNHISSCFKEQRIWAAVVAIGWSHTPFSFSFETTTRVSAMPWMDMPSTYVARLITSLHETTFTVTRGGWGESAYVQSCLDGSLHLKQVKDIRSDHLTHPALKQ